MDLNKPTSRTERKKEDTKQKIINVGMRLIRDQGLEATTMEQIAAEVDIAKGTLYNYFPVKEAILDEFIKRRFIEQSAECIAALQKLPDTRSRLIWMLEFLLQGVQTQSKIFEKYVIYRMQSLVSFQQDDSEKSGFYVLIHEIVRLGQPNAEICRDLPLDVLEDLVEFIFIEIVMQYYLHPETFDVHATVERYVDLFLNGVSYQP